LSARQSFSTWFGVSPVCSLSIGQLVRTLPVRAFAFVQSHVNIPNSSDVIRRSSRCSSIERRHRRKLSAPAGRGLT
jgi:hypothetical protein